MKNRKVARFEVRVLQRAEVEVEQDSSYKLDCESQDDHIAHQRADAVTFQNSADGLLHRFTRRVDLLPDYQSEEGRYGHYPQAAYLDQRQNHQLPKKGEVGVSVFDHQTGDANRRGGGKKSVDHRDFAFHHRHRQLQQHRSQKDCQQKTDYHQIKRVVVIFF